MVGVVLGLVLMLTGVELPGLVREFLSTVGGASTAIIMFIVGAQMGELGLAEALRDRQIYSFCLMKLVVIRPTKSSRRVSMAPMMRDFSLSRACCMISL